MATFTKRGKKWRVQVMVAGERRSGTFDTKSEAAQWAVAETAAGKRGPAIAAKTVRDALARLHALYVEAGASRSDQTRAKRLQSDPLADLRLSNVATADLSDFRDRRIAATSAASARRELNLIRGMFRRCREEWGWMNRNPFEGFKAPKSPESRKRRISPDEIEAVRIAFGVAGELTAVTLTNRVGLAFLFAIETAMRASEILALTWPHVHAAERYVHLPRSKNGDARDVPLSTFAGEILAALPVLGGEPCFLLTEGQRDALWRKGLARAGVDGLHFHDTRAEGIWRLSKKLDVLQLARAVGHRDVRSLMIYYRESATEMAAKLD